MRDFDTLFPVIVLVIVPLLVMAWIKRDRTKRTDLGYDEPGDWSN